MSFVSFVSNLNTNIVY